jgi:MFS family permease
VQGSGDRPRDTYRWWVLVTVVFGAFASLLDSTIVNTALPRIQRDFGANLHLASYVVTGYVLAAGVVVPTAGFLANRFGMKRVYLSSLALFIVGSLLCGIAPNISLLIAARVLQGAGGAALYPISFAILFSVFSYEERGKANGLWWASTGTVSGPILLSLPLMVGFVVVAWRSEAPLLRLRLYQGRNYVLGAAISLSGSSASQAGGHGRLPRRRWWLPNSRHTDCSVPPWFPHPARRGYHERGGEIHAGPWYF